MSHRSRSRSQLRPAGRRRRPIAATLVVVGLLAAGCAGNTPSDESSDGESVDVATEDVPAGEELTFLGEEEQPTSDGSGPEAPIDEPLFVSIETPPDASLAGVIVVTVEDASLADQQAAVVSEVRFPVAELDGNRIPINVPIPVESAGELTVAVHVDRDETGTISQGDLLSTTVVPLLASSGEVAVPVEVV